MTGAFTGPRHLTFITLLLTACLWATTSLASNFRFDIPAQPLPMALDLFARQSGYQVSADSEALNGKQSQAIAGELSLRQALDGLLQGSGLSWFISAGHTVVIANSQQDNQLTVLPAVKVQAGAEAAALDQPYQTPASASYISQKDIQRFRGSSVGDIFQGESGVLIGENRNSGGLDINIRGMQGQGRVPVLLDGSRQETTVYRGYAGVASRTYIDPDLIGGVDIHKGPEMSAQGTGATGGVVNIRTLEASDLITDDGDFAIRLKTSVIGNSTSRAVDPGTPSGLNPRSDASDQSYRINCVTESLCSGDYDIRKAFGPQDNFSRPDLLDMRSWAGSLAMAKRFDQMDLILAYARRQQGNYFAGRHGPAPKLDLSNQVAKGFYTEVIPELLGASRFRAEEMIANTNYESTSSLVKGVFYLNDYQTLKLGWQNYDSTYGELMPSQLLWLGQVRQTPGSQVNADTYTLRYNQQSQDSDWLDLEANLWHTDTESTNHSYSETFTNGLAETEDYQRWGSDISNRNRWSELAFHYGLSWQREHIDTQPTPGQDKFGRNGERREYSAFINLDWQLVDNLTLSLGLRHTRFDVKDNKPIRVDDSSDFCQLIPDTDTCRTLKYSNNFSGSAPLASLSWQFAPGLQLYLRYAEALRMPSLFESSAGFSTQPALDVDLKPEHTYNKEIGLNVMRDNLLLNADRLRLKLAYFRNRTNDYLTRTSPDLWEKDARKNTFVSRNIDSLELHGAEISGEYDIDWLFTKFGFTYYDHIEVCHFGSYRPERCNDYGVANSYVNNMIPPNHNASATLGSRWFNRELELGLRFTWMGKRNSTPDNDDATKQGRLLPIAWHSYRLLDFFLSYQPSERFSVDLNVDNLTDQYYLDALSLGLVPAPGRTARLGLTFSY